MSHNPPPLTDRDRMFVEAYCTVADFDGTKAYRAAFGKKTKNDYRLAQKYLDKPSVQKAIDARMRTKARLFSIKEDEILEGLHKEATNENARPSERIQAWVQLGKHLGMFREKVEEKDTQITYNIVNYNAKNLELEQATEKAVKALTQEQIEDSDV